MAGPDRPEAVVFDLGRVLINWDPAGFYDAEIGPEARARLFAEVGLDEMNAAIDRGAPFRDTVMALAEAHPDWAPAIRMWHDRWLDMASPAIEGSVAILEALHARKMPLIALTNFGIDSFAIARGAYPFLARFDRLFVSGHLGVMKPEARIYRMVEEGTAIDPGRLFFIDDRADNIAAAAARGWQTHLFRSPAKLARALVAAGCLDPADSPV